MQNRPLGRTGITVPPVCLGTMTFGAATDPDGAFAQMDFAVDNGLTFWDTAEMYAVPPSPESYGRTEEIIGDWFVRTGRRDEIFLTSKVIGRPRGGFEWIRDGKNRLDRANITRAVEDSLRRLKTDRIDLYQIHWPDRPMALFGSGTVEGEAGDQGVPIPETLEVLGDLVKAGKIRAVGVSNETAWGLMTWLKASETAGLPRIVTIQNALNLLNRTFEDALMEVCLREGVGLLAYSPLAGGTLTGKYLGGTMPEGSRRDLDPRRSRYDRPRGDEATAAYVEIARRHGLEPAHMAIAWVRSRPYVTATIIGATRLDQLKRNLPAFDVQLTPEVLEEIEAVHRAIPNPCP